MKVSANAIHYAYEIAKRHYDGTLSFTEAYSLISYGTGIAANSAKDYVKNLKYMVEGKCDVRTLNTYATEYYIK